MGLWGAWGRLHSQRLKPWLVLQVRYPSAFTMYSTYCSSRCSGTEAL